MIILLDMDGVLADFETGFVEGWRARFPGVPPLDPALRRHFNITDDYPPEQRSMVVDVYGAEGFFLHLAPVAGAIEGVRALEAMGHDIRFCSSPLRRYRHCVGEKYAWIDHYFGLDFVERLILTRDKTLVRGDVLIDDKPEITGAVAPAWRRIVFDQPYNRGVRAPRMTWANWREVLLD